MKVRTAIARMPLKAGLTVAGWGIVAILATAVLSACSTSPPTTVFTPSPGGSPTSTATATSTATSTATETTSPSESTSTPASESPSPPSPSPTPAIVFSPTSSGLPAPNTGGGGTAGLQDTMLFGIGALALLAGTGSIIYRKKLTRNR